jgi:hypothetical protein
VLACYADHIAATRRPPVVIGVGDVKDYTGKYSINEGNAITQGGALMVYSALGKLGGAVSIAERFDPVIAERELAYADRRQLGRRPQPPAGRTQRRAGRAVAAVLRRHHQQVRLLHRGRHHRAELQHQLRRRRVRA